MLHQREPSVGHGFQPITRHCWPASAQQDASTLKTTFLPQNPKTAKGSGRTSADVGDARREDTAVQRLEAELGAAGRQRLDDARDVVADEDEARHPAVRLHRPPQRVLGVLRMQHWESSPGGCPLSSSSLESTGSLYAHMKFPMAFRALNIADHG